MVGGPHRAQVAVDGCAALSMGVGVAKMLHTGE